MDHGSPNSLVELSLAAGSMLDVSGAELAACAASAGFSSVGARLSGPHGDLVEPGTLGDVRIHDAEVFRIGAGGRPEPLIEAAALAGAAHLLVVSDVDEAATLSALADVSRRCHAAGLVPALEYMAWTCPAHPSHAAAMAAETGCVVVVDVLHHRRVGADADALADIVRRGVFGWLQLCDAPRSAPTDLVHEARHGRRPPGLGDLDVGDLLSAVPGGATVSIEVQSDELLLVAPPDRSALLHRQATQALAAAGIDVVRPGHGRPAPPNSTG